MALVNNMPDAALLATEQAYRKLAAIATEWSGVRVHFSFFAIDGIARSDDAGRMLRQRYGSFDDLRRGDFDAVIVTGAEPRAAELADESFWMALTDVLDWAEAHTTSTLLSCLAAHAAVLHFDGVKRMPLIQKCAGVFDIEKVCDHALTGSLPPSWRSVHSRQNDVSESALRACGYKVLGRAVGAGVHLFVKQTSTLRVCFQGHPEYDSDALRREYVRDVTRFLRGEQTSYPAVPATYFDQMSEQRLAAFRMTAERTRCLESMQGFPADLVIRSPSSVWLPSAASVFANWLTLVAARSQRPGARIRMAAMQA